MLSVYGMKDELRRPMMLLAKSTNKGLRISFLLGKDSEASVLQFFRTFVMKFHEMGLLTTRKAGNRVFYHVGGTSDGRPL